MGQFVTDILPIEYLYWPGLQGGVEPPPISEAATPDGKVEQRIRTASEGRYSLTLPAANREATRWQALYEFYMSVGGKENSFRVLDPRTYFNTITGQALGAGDGVETAFQLVHAFGTYLHTVDKPVLASVVPSIGGVAQTSRFAVGEETGIITFSADLTGAITAASQAAACQLTKAGHGLLTGDTAHLSTFTGDWAALNGNRYPVTKTGTDTFTIPVDTAGFTAYSSNGGTLHTIPQAGETVTADAQHYYQVRFASRFLGPEVVINEVTSVAGIVLLEVREP